MGVDANKVPQITLSTGQKVPCIGMGTFGSDRFTAEQVSNAVAGAIRAGYRMFDCASCYGNEDQIGEVFTNAINEGVVERKDLFIMTRYGMICTGGSRRLQRRALPILNVNISIFTLFTGLSRTIMHRGAMWIQGILTASLSR